MANILIKHTKALIDGEMVPADIAIRDGVIVSMDGAPAEFVPDTVIDGEGKLCMPGLVNAHTHAYMSLFRSYADDVAFGEWLFGRILPKEDTLTPEDAYWGTMLSCIEMIKSGTTSFCDMHLFAGIPAKAAHDAGMRAVITRGLTGSDGGERRIAEALSEWNEWKHDPLITGMLAPHAIYTCDEPFLRRVIEVAEETGLGINIHLSESQKEIDDCYAAHGCSPVEYLTKLGMFAHKTLAAHCPKSNLKLANGIAPVKQMLEAGVNVCIGTDGAGSNNALNMFSEMNYACLLPKGVNKDGATVSAKEVLRMATVGGAKALGLQNVGELKVGMQADIAILGMHHVAFRPLHDIAGALCYAASGNEVETVIIGGEIVMQNGVLTKIDEEEVYYHAERITADW